MGGGGDIEGGGQKMPPSEKKTYMNINIYIYVCFFFLTVAKKQTFTFFGKIVFLFKYFENS